MVLYKAKCEECELLKNNLKELDILYEVPTQKTSLSLREHHLYRSYSFRLGFISISDSDDHNQGL
jgi:hypothetical protein